MAIQIVFFRKFLSQSKNRTNSDTVSKKIHYLKLDFKGDKVGDILISKQKILLKGHFTPPSYT